MSFDKILGLVQTAVELGLVYSLTVLALFLSYSMLNVCDLSTDGCFTFGAAVGTLVAMGGHPWLSLPAAMAAGIVSGLVTAVLQTRMGVQSLLAGIVVNTGLYSVNLMLTGNKAQLTLGKAATVFTLMREGLGGTPFEAQSRLAVLLIITALAVVFLSLFLRTRLGLSIRATGNNVDMVRSSSINPIFTTTVGLCLSNSLTALSGCLMAQQQKSFDISMASSGVLTVALASLLIGGVFFGKHRSIPLRAVGAVLGAIIFRLVYTVALRLHMPAFMLKLVSAVIVVLAISVPYLKTQAQHMLRRSRALRERGAA